MIVRAAHDRDNPFFQICRATAQDANLSARALGVLVYLLSKPDSWEPTVDDICRRFTDVGQRQAYKLINEVFIPLRYAKRTQERKGGRIANWVTAIYESPDGENCQVESPDGSFQHGTYQMALLTTIDNTDKTKQRRKKKQKDVGAVAPDPRTSHTAIQTCRTVTNRYPPKELWDKLIQVLGDSPNVTLLVECRTEWVERGYNRNSWKWATDWYLTGVPPRATGNGSPPKNPAAYVGKNTTPKESKTVEIDMDIDEFVDTAIRAHDLVWLSKERDAILKRGAQHAWEKRVLEYFETPIPGNEMATPAAVTEQTRG